MQLDVQAVLGALAALVVVLGGVGAGYVRLRRWVRTVAVDSRESAEQLRTTNGRTVAQLVEETVRELREVREVVAINRDIALFARNFAEQISARLDRHLLTHGELPTVDRR